MNITEDEEARREMDRWMLEKTIDLTEKFDSKDFEFLKKLKVECKNKQCSEFEFGVLWREVYLYYDFEELKNKKNKKYYEEKLLEDYLDQCDIMEQGVRDGHLTGIIEQRKLEGTGVSEEEYKMLLTKIENIKLEIKIAKKLRRMERNKVKFTA